VLKIRPLEHDVMGDEKPVELALEQTEESDLVRLAVQELSELTRLVFHLRVTEQLSFKEIADMAGLSEVAARQHMHQARARLLRRLSPAPATK
jgi:RNA polymerase sigma factor (sigma-70 family)